MSRGQDLIVAVKIMTHVESVFLYTSDPASDYMVLNHIRSTWKDKKLELFLGALFQIYAERTKDPALFYLQYIPGDYSRAALEVLRLTE